MYLLLLCSRVLQAVVGSGAHFGRLLGKAQVEPVVVKSLGTSLCSLVTDLKPEVWALPFETRPFGTSCVPAWH